MSKKILLIADDDEMNRRIIRKFLKDSFDVLEAGDGEEALEILDSRQVDALLLDIIMPRLDGLEVLRHMQNNVKFQQIAVLVATSTKEKTERMALSLGADDVVSKPYDPIVIRRRLENIVAAKLAREQTKLLQRDDTDAFIKEKMDRLSEEIGSRTDKIRKCAGLIQENMDNRKLIVELAEEITREADSVVSVFAEDK